MKYAHHIKISVFIKTEENFEKVKLGFVSLFPFSLLQEKIKLEEEMVSGVEDKEIKILTVFLKKTKHTNQFIEKLQKKLSEEDKKKIISQKESRLDEDVWFFIRLDKDSLVNDESLKLVEKGDCIHIKIKLAAFPKKREVALKIIDELFS